MKLATHNSMSYLPPKKWWMYPFRFIARCQSKSIEEQYEKYGIRLFDLRVSFDNDEMEFRHGLMAFKGSVEDTLKYLNSKKDVKVHLVLEITKPSDIQETLFSLACSRLSREYPDIVFFEGVRKYDWCPVYQFSSERPMITSEFSSVKSKLKSLWPWLYARLHNKDSRKNFINKGYLMLDFIEL